MEGRGRWSVGGRWSVVGCRLSVVGCRWTVDGGRWTVGGGRWAVGGGLCGKEFRTGQGADATRVGFHHSSSGFQSPAPIYHCSLLFGEGLGGFK